MAWATQQEARDDLRNFLNDGPTDKLRHLQLLFGITDGVNKIFKTLEFKRVTNFFTAAAPLGIYVNNAIVAVTSDDPIIGSVTLTDAPLSGDRVEGVFYSQWFTDDELDFFLSSAGGFIECNDTVVNLNEGLIPSAKHWAAGEAYQKLALQYIELQSSTFRRDDSDEAPTSFTDLYNKMADRMFKQARQLRKDFYNGRKDKAGAPLFASNAGNVKAVVPPR